MRRRVVRRALEFFGDLPPSPPRRNLLAPQKPPAQRSALPIPKPLPRRAAGRARSASRSFATYLACPYRYYLRHVLRLEPLADSQSRAGAGRVWQSAARRAPAIQPGRRRPARAGQRRSGASIFGYLSNFLDTLAGARFGLKHCRPAVRVQIEQARTRLRALAEWQAQRTSEGWQIVHGEDTETQAAVTPISTSMRPRPFKLHGRIDRIDYHAAVADARDPRLQDGRRGQRARRRRTARPGEWIDLQLPLYRHLRARRPD